MAQRGWVTRPRLHSSKWWKQEWDARQYDCRVYSISHSGQTYWVAGEGRLHWSWGLRKRASSVQTQMTSSADRASSGRAWLGWPGAPGKDMPPQGGEGKPFLHSVSYFVFEPHPFPSEIQNCFSFSGGLGAQGQQEFMLTVRILASRMAPQGRQRWGNICLGC